MTIDFAKIDFTKLNGLVPVVVQNAATLDVLMLGFMNQQALEQTIATNQVTFFSRSKNRLWKKGETSGHTLDVVGIHVDCDHDSLLILAYPNGPTCHTGTKSCFGNPPFDLLKLFQLISERKRNAPPKSYTHSLFAAGLEAIIAKIEEESEEVVRAARSEGKQRLIEESCDVLYHLFVLLAHEDISMQDLVTELQKRHAAGSA